jgi:hypothetical protein
MIKNLEQNVDAYCCVGHVLENLSRLLKIARAENGEGHG